jgi:hypothetical protein
MYRIRRFGVVSTANTVALMYGLLFGVIFLIVAAFGGLAFVSGSGTSGSFALPSLLIALLFAAVIYAVIFWIVTAVICVMYNGVAGRTGGIEILVEQRLPPQPAPGWGPYGPTSPVGPYGAPQPPGWGQPPTPPGWGGPPAQPPGWGQPG